MFKKNYTNNDLEYSTAKQVVFAGGAPEKFRNVPTFTTKESLSDVIKVSYLTPEGMSVYIKGIFLLIQ